MTNASNQHRLPNGNHKAGDPFAVRRDYPKDGVESIWKAPDGWPLRRFDWPADGDAHGSLLFMTGRVEFYEKYLETYADFRAKGWNVTTVDWRGQGGSGRLGPLPQMGHITDFGLWVDDLAALFADWRANNPGPHVVLGHSMGGHIVLRALVEQRISPDAVILSAPMLLPKGTGLPLWLSHLFAKLMLRLGKGEKLAWKVSEKPLEAQAARQRLLTHDLARFADEQYWLDRKPELRGGPASWLWVERAYASARLWRDKAALASVFIPVLCLATSSDELVDAEVIKSTISAIPNAELVMFGDECAHEIFRESNSVRDAALEACFSFLDREVPLS